MTTYGLTSTGFRRKTYAEMLTDVEASERARISAKLDLSEADPLGNINRIHLDELASVWEAAEASVGALDPDTAVDQLLEGVCKLTGIRRRAATKGTVTVTLTVTKALTISAGALLLYVSGEETNLWENDDEITAAGAGTVDATFTSVSAGADAVALAGTLTGISTPVSGLSSVTNTLDAVAGQDVETLDELRARREASPGGAGKATIAAIRADVAAVDGVVDVRVFENDTDATVDGIPPGYTRVVVWDSAVPAADDDELAQAIYDAKAGGTRTYGAASGDAEDPWGTVKPQNFDRATELEVYIDVTVEGTASADDVKTALLAAHPELIDQNVLYAALLSAAYQVDGVTNVTALTLGLTASPTGTADIVVADDEVGVLDSSRITVT